MEFAPHSFAQGVFQPEEIAIMRSIYGRIVENEWFSSMPGKREEFARYLISMYRRGLVVPGKLEALCLVVARQRFSEASPKTDAIVGRRVLVVEDEYHLAHEVAQKLEKLGAAVLGPVGTLSEALEIAGNAEITFDAALLDIALNGEMVFPVAAVLKMRSIPFAFISGYDEQIVPPSYRRTPRFEKPADWIGIATHLIDKTYV
jgi:CheY-like chemotaxis protein